VVTQAVKQEQAAFLERGGLSRRRACSLLSVSRAHLHRESKMEKKDAPIRARLREISSSFPREGYRLAWAYLASEGKKLSMWRCWRIWSQSGLQVPVKKRKRRGPRKPAAIVRARQKDQIWALDFVFDGCVGGRQLKCLTIVDEHTRESLCIRTEHRLGTDDVVDELNLLLRNRDAPQGLRLDNGQEFCAHKVKRWADQHGTKLLHIKAGSPWENGVNESFNGRLRDECLSQEDFWSLAEAKVVIEKFRKHYNEVRPHGSLGYKTPLEFAKLQPAGLTL